jgi:hypothetical protein
MSHDHDLERAIQDLMPGSGTTRRGLLAAASGLALAIGLSLPVAVEEALAKGSFGGHLGGRHGKNQRGQHHKRHHGKHHKNKRGQGVGAGAGCRESANCDAGQLCCKGKCVNPSTDANNCGSCGTKCDAGFCQSGKCVNCTVCSTCTTKTIQAAVDSSAVGSTILICSGTYKERVQVTKSLTLEGFGLGNGPVVIDGQKVASSVPVLSVTADNVTLRGLTVTGGKANDESGGGVVNNGKNLLLDRVRLVDNDAGAFSGGGLANVGNDVSVTLSTCEVFRNRAAIGGGLSNDNSTARITLRNSTHVTLNTAVESGGGIDNKGIIAFEGLAFVTQNTSNGGAGTGGGIFNRGTITGSDPISALVKDNVPDNCIDNSGGIGCQA